jgi:hypothetical protein
VFNKTIAAAAIGLGSVLTVAAPASAHGDDTTTDQIGLLNINNAVNNLCALPWNDGNVLAIEVPLFSPNQYQACNDGKTIQKW